MNIKSILATVTIVVSAVFLTGCARAPANVHVLSTENCGAEWKKVETATAVPKHPGNPCGYNTALPAWPMPGDADFKTQFKGQVLAQVRFSYTYQIIDPIAFIKSASYLGKMGGTLEISADDTGKKYEMAENMIIDKSIREITGDLTDSMEIVDANPSQIEESVFVKLGEALKKRGVQIVDMQMVLMPEEQTRLAIDTATAIRVYRNANIEEVGKQVMIAKAGAARIQLDVQKVAKEEK